MGEGKDAIFNEALRNSRGRSKGGAQRASATQTAQAKDRAMNISSRADSRQWPVADWQFSDADRVKQTLATDRPTRREATRGCTEARHLVETRVLIRPQDFNLLRRLASRAVSAVTAGSNTPKMPPAKG